MRSAPPASRRRRRARPPLSLDERQNARQALARRVIPTVGFFGYSLLAGLVLALSTFAPAGQLGLLLLGLLLTPLMAPVIGLALGLLSGSPALTGQSLGAFLLGAGLLVGVSTAMHGLMESLGHSATLTPRPQLLIDLLLTTVGALGTAQWLLRGDRRVYLGNVLLAYGLYLPLSQIGLGALSFWGHRFLLYLFGALAGSMISLWQMGFRPRRPGATAVLGGGAVVLWLGLWLGLGYPLRPALSALPASPTPTLIPTPPLTATLPLPPSPTATPRPTVSPTPTAVLNWPTATFTLSPSPTLSPTPEPVFAIIHAPEEYQGAYIREEPGFNGRILKALNNGTLVQILGDLPVEKDQATWIEVYVPELDLRGWVVQALLLRATPAPQWDVTPTP